MFGKQIKDMTIKNDHLIDQDKEYFKFAGQFNRPWYNNEHDKGKDQD